MTRTEFMGELQRSLYASKGSGAGSGHMRYYQDYFDTQLGMGKREEEIAEELGNPRLLAKTITEAAKREGRGERIAEYDEVYEDTAARERQSSNLWKYRLPGWLWLILVFVAVVVIVGVVNSVIVAMLPILFPVLCLILLLRLFRRK